MTATEQEPITPEVRAAVEHLLDVPDERTIHQRMIAILGDLPAIGKDQRNEQQKFMYRGHDDVMNALNPLLAVHGVYATPSVIKRVTGERQTKSGSTMYEVNLCIRYTFWGAMGDYVEATAWGEGTDLGDKATNKAMTMAFKAVLAQAFAISTAELSDADAGAPEETTRGSGGVQPRAEGTQRKRTQFDPAKHLLPGAIVVRSGKEGEEDATAIRQGQRDLDPTQPWTDIEEFLCLHLFGAKYEELTTAQKREFYTRLANAVVKVGDLAGTGDFPPPTAEQIQEGYAWAFNGCVLALSGPETAAEAPAEPETLEEAQKAAEGDSA